VVKFKDSFIRILLRDATLTVEELLKLV